MKHSDLQAIIIADPDLYRIKHKSNIVRLKYNVVKSQAWRLLRNSWFNENERTDHYGEILFYKPYTHTLDLTSDIGTIMGIVIISREEDDDEETKAA